MSAITAATMLLEVGSGLMEVRLRVPERKRPGPAVLLMYHRDGFDTFTDKVTTRLSEAGYLVAVPDVSHRVSREIPMADRKQYFKDSEVVADIAATVDYLATRSDIDPRRIVIMGHCMGGRMTMLGAAAMERFCGAVVLYGGGVHLTWGEDAPPPLTRLDRIKCPLIGFFGNLDKNPSPEQVNAMETALKKASARYQFHRYDGAGHGFQNRDPGTPGDQAAAGDAWTRTFAFLEQTCAG